MRKKVPLGKFCNMEKEKGETLPGSVQPLMRRDFYRE
jgi:hypothetical protein